jgi:hypothetical protein
MDHRPLHDMILPHSSDLPNSRLMASKASPPTSLRPYSTETRSSGEHRFKHQGSAVAHRLVSGDQQKLIDANLIRTSGGSDLAWPNGLVD